MEGYILRDGKEQLTLSTAAVDKLLQSGQGDAALLYLALCRFGRGVTPEELERALPISRLRIDAAERVLHVLAGVVRPVDFIVIDPAAAGGKRLAAPQADLSRDPTHFRSFLRLVRQSRAGLPVYFLFIIRSGVIINIVPQAGAHCNCPAGVI